MITTTETTALIEVAVDILKVGGAKDAARVAVFNRLPAHAPAFKAGALTLAIVEEATIRVEVMTLEAMAAERAEIEDALLNQLERTYALREAY